MDPVFRVRLVNAVTLTCILALYVLYDAAFRFWMARSDAAPLISAFMHSEKMTLPHSGEVGLAFDAAAACVRTAALQRHLLRPSSTSAAGPGSSSTTSGSSGGYAYAPVTAALPMAAVVVESTWLTPDQDGVSYVYAQRLLEGYRQALFSGAPWLLLSGTAAEAAVGLQFLRTLPDPGEALFRDAVVQRLPLPLVRVARQLRASMEPFATLGAWMHGAGTRPLHCFPAAHVTRGHSVPLAEWPGVRVPEWTSLEASLRQLLSSHALAETDGNHLRPASLVLGAEWLRHITAHTPGAGGRSSGSSSAELSASSGGQGQEGQPQVTVYATHAVGADLHTRPLEGGAAAAATEHGGSSRDTSVSAAWEQPRVREVVVNGTAAPAHVVVPGLVMISEDDMNRRARHAARALQRLIERTLVHRRATEEVDSRRAVESAAAGWDWWWLGRSYGVAVVAGGWEQQRVKLLYMKAFRDAVADSQEGLRRAVHLLHQSRCHFELGPPSPECQSPRRTQPPPSALPFTTAVPARTRIYVLPAPNEEVQRVQPQPDWLNYTGELPPSINPEALHVAQLLGRVSFFIYFNYRRWMDWFLASMPVGSYQDHLVLISVLMSDFAEHRISWRDIPYLR